MLLQTAIPSIEGFAPVLSSSEPRAGINLGQYLSIDTPQAQIISAVTSNNGDFAGVWAPNNYTLAEKGGAKLLCSGYDAGAIVPGALITRPDFAKEKPELVAKVSGRLSAGVGVDQGATRRRRAR